MISPQLIATLNQLSPSLQMEVLHYAQYLAVQQLQPEIPEKTPTQYRQAGTLKGMFIMAEDFDAPLEDLREYM
jgi:Protein of unknown function (DUF2281)